MTKRLFLYKIIETLRLSTGITQVFFALENKNHSQGNVHNKSQLILFPSPFDTFFPVSRPLTTSR